MEITLEPPFLIIKPGVSEEEFYRLSDEDCDWEYLDGKLIMHSPASDRHEDIFSFLNALLRCYLDETGGAVVRGSRYPMRLDERWSPEPDLLVVRDARRHLMTRQRLEGAADMVVEIVSESDRDLDYRDKLPRYRQAGIEEIWIVDPFSREVLVETKEGSGYRTLKLPAGRLTSTVLPGFWIEVSWLWQQKLPSTVQCLRQVLGGEREGS
jgi:Uma2 family endonuclease